MKLKRSGIIFILFILTFCALAFSSCEEEQTYYGNYKVRIALKECEGMNIISEKIYEVNSGKDIEFEVEISEDYIYLGNTANAAYNPKTGKIKLSHVIYPTNIEMILIPKSELLHLSFEKNDTHGFVNIVEGNDYLSEPGAVTVAADGYGGYVFDGWSLDGFLEDGGKLISKEAVFSFFMKANTKLYANFTNHKGYTINYHTNGGQVMKDGSDLFKYKDVFKAAFPCQQTLESNRTFIREGYVAVGYSTEPAEYTDYPTVNYIPDFSNMGGVCEVDKNKRELDLYVVWAKASPAQDFTVKNGIITGYKGNDRTVVIPETIDGTDIKGIATRAFNEAEVTRVVIPRTVVTVEEQAFYKCKFLSELVFFDSVTKIGDKSFEGCDRLATVVLNAHRLPKYSGSAEGSFCIKYERVRTLKTKKIVVVSGSSTLNGLVSEKLEKNFPGYSVVNYGTNAANQSAFFIEVISKYVIEGDIIVHAPEFFASGPMGSNVIAPKMFRGNEQCYDIFREVDMTNYVGFFDAYYKFLNGDPRDGSLTPALKLTSKPYQNENTGMNIYGDLASNRPKPTYTPNPRSRFNYNILNAAQLNRVNKLVTEKGGYLVMSFATCDAGGMHESQLNAAEFDKFTDNCQSKLDYPVISNVGTYIMDHKYFFNSGWHCTNEGADLRTDYLTSDLKKFLSSISK